ncbi:sugar transporter, partial [Paraphoma chrysanthemicola]
PLNNVTEREAIRFHRKYKLPVERDLGWDQAAMAGAAIEVMRDLGKPTITGPSSGVTARPGGEFSVDLDHNTLLLGLTIGVPFFTGAILGLIVTDPITRILRFGRRGAICVAGMFSFISVIGSASVNKWEHLLGFRILLGAGMAGKASIVPILLSETSPKDVRGFLLVFWQLFVAFGLAAGSIANVSVYRLNVHSSWRYMFISAFIPALLLLSLILFSPESPRWLLKESGAVKNLSKNALRRKELIQEAYKSLVELRGEAVPILAAGELFLMHTRLIDEQRRLKAALDGRPYTTSAANRTTGSKSPFVDVIRHISWRDRVKLMFSYSGYTNRAHRAAAAVMVSQQLCGINLIAFMADTFFRYSFFHQNHQTSPSQNIKLLGASVGLMLLGFLGTIPALFVMDISDGRRRVLNWSFPVMAFSLLGSALVLKIPEDSNQPDIGAIVGHYIFLVLFMIAYSIGEGPAAFVVSAEVFPLVNRELGMSLAVCWNFMGAGFLAVIAPWLLKKLDQFGVLLLFAGTNLIAWFLCYWLVPSTGKEDLETVFEQLDITSWFMFKYTLKTLSHTITKPVDYFLQLCSKPWDDCGYPRKRKSPRAEWQLHPQQSETTHSGPPGSTSSSEDEADEMQVGPGSVPCGAIRVPGN